MMVFNNTTNVVKDELAKVITKGSRVSIAAACFSIYAYQALAEQLKDIDNLRFIFTSPTFVAEKTQKEKREFYISRLRLEKSLYGTEFDFFATKMREMSSSFQKLFEAFLSNLNFCGGWGTFLFSDAYI